ncbi:glycosyl hydrolase family 28-related protein [Paraburkholderia caribensis]|uniref:Rhamnogalacturonase A/B/Epimerase-like pectate lyase domain-containing protein n=1 Tax=Paraburkholderia caribensis TaxID=75105 RepID=A0A9Q6S2M7_9BURK|nr:glycosyl hydrolase family 28-related protein [Paraburkholderia caribensis]QLB63474.1 hypothetical protein A9O66_14435 [Paraburkholderia caribensis]
MTVTTDNSRISYAGDGISTTFQFPYYFLSSGDVHVFINSVEQTSGFTVTGAGNPAGGSVAFSAAPAPGAIVQLIRDPDLLQQTNLPPNDPFPSDAVEKALDKLTMIAQARKANESRTIRYQLSETVDGLLPVAAQRANNVLGFDAAGNQTMVPLPASVGAGDLRNEAWTAGTDFVAGTSTSVTLSRAYGTKANLGTVVMAGVPQDPSTYDLSADGLTLIFNTVIPAFVKRIWCIGGTTISLAIGALFTAAYTGAVTRTIVDKLRDVVSVMDFGADPSGIEDSTVAFQNAVNAARKVIVPAGTYLCGQVTIPSGTSVIGEGKASIILPAAGLSASVTYLWQSAVGASDVEIGGLQFNVPISFQNCNVLNFQQGSYCYAHDLYMPNAGGRGVMTYLQTDSCFERIVVLNAYINSLNHTNGTRVKTTRCVGSVPNSIDHAIRVSGGSDIEVSNCFFELTPVGFGIYFNLVVRGKIVNNTVHNTAIEGIAIGTSEVIVEGNSLWWDGAHGTDYGISASGDPSPDGTTILLKIVNNIIDSSHKSGIALASISGVAISWCDISGNTIVNPNAGNAPIASGGQCGVLLYGSGVQQAIVQNNNIVDTVGNMQWGIAELNSGGLPINNKFINNRIVGPNLTANISKGIGSIEALNQNWATNSGLQSWSPTIGSTSGSITSAAVAAAVYYETEKRVDFFLSVTIVTNGSGAGAVTFTPPFTLCSLAGTNVVGGSGIENAVTNKGLALKALNSTTVAVTFADGTYPGADGRNLTISGTFFRQ